MAILLRPATEADLVDIIDVSTAAFPPNKDAITRHLFPPHLQDSDGIQAAAIRELRIARKGLRFQARHTTMIVAIDEALGDKIVGYSIWITPLEEGDKEDARPPPVKLECFDRDAFAELIRILTEDERETFGENGTKDVWQLDSLGVDPLHQRRGIGKMLLEWGMKEAAKQGKSCYLVATPAGLPLYRAAGFDSVRNLDIFGAPHMSMILRPSPE